VTRSHVKENILSLHNFDLLQSHEGHVDVESVIKMFEPFMMEGRKARIIEVIEQRTFSILPVVEGTPDSPFSKSSLVMQESCVVDPPWCALLLKL
jgi:hypothetical protein